MAVEQDPVLYEGFHRRHLLEQEMPVTESEVGCLEAHLTGGPRTGGIQGTETDRAPQPSQG